MGKISNVMWGIVLIIIGVVLGLNALEITNINLFFEGWWTLFIIVPSFIGLLNDKDKTGGIFGIFIGLALLLMCQGIISFALLWKLSLPVLLILGGASLLFKGKVDEAIKSSIRKFSTDKTVDKSYCSTFSSMNVKLEDEEINKYELDAIFGELNVTLTKSIKKDLLIKASAIFGSIKIDVPDDVEVKLLSNPIFGDVTDKRKSKSCDSRRVIYVDARAIFGGVEIR